MTESYLGFLYWEDPDEDMAEWEREKIESWQMGYRSSVPIGGFFMGEFRPDEFWWWAGLVAGTATHAPIVYYGADLVTKGWWATKVGPGPVVDVVGHGLTKAYQFGRTAAPGAALGFGRHLSRAVSGITFGSILYAVGDTLNDLYAGLSGSAGIGDMSGWVPGYS